MKVGAFVSKATDPTQVAGAPFKKKFTVGWIWVDHRTEIV
jgi:hypothetical protein